MYVDLWPRYVFIRFYKKLVEHRQVMISCLTHTHLNSIIASSVYIFFGGDLCRLAWNTVLFLNNNKRLRQPYAQYKPDLTHPLNTLGMLFPTGWACSTYVMDSPPFLLGVLWACTVYLERLLRSVGMRKQDNIDCRKGSTRIWLSYVILKVATTMCTGPSIPLPQAPIDAWCADPHTPIHTIRVPKNMKVL